MKNVDQFYQCKVSAPSYLPEKETVTWQLRCYLQIFLDRSGEQMVLISDLGCETKLLARKGDRYLAIALLFTNFPR